MFARLKRTVVSFVAVAAVFVVYRVMAVPFIEPKRPEKRVAHVSPAERPINVKTQDHLGGYARFFPEGSWERDNPIVLESETSKLLVKEYVNQPDGTLKLNPCTVIYLPEGEAESADSNHRVIILQAPQGAILKFDEAVDLGRGKIGRLQGGIMPGPVVIQSGPTKPDGGDDFFAMTHDVQMQENLIFTPSEVDFRFGASQGHGRNMRIELLPGPSGGNSHGANFGGVQSFQLLNDVQMHLQPGSTSFVPGRQNQPTAAAAGSRTVTFSGTPGTGGANSDSNPPVDIRCQGLFEFDLVQNVAAFHDHVDVVRPHTTGQSDQINGELLNVYFAPRAPVVPGTAPAGAGATPTAGELAGTSAKGPSQKQSSGASRAMPQLEPRRLVVRGNPVVVRAESMGGEIRGDYLQYDIVDRHLIMQSAAGNVQIESPQLSGQVAMLEAWSREALATDPASSVNQRGAAGQRSMGRNSSPGAPQNPGQNQPRQHSEIYGNTLRILSISGPDGTDVERINVDGNVRFLQSAAQPSERPLATTGDFLEVLHANAPEAEVAISGHPAQISAQGLTMVGQTVHLNRGENRLWIDGAGRMTLTGDPTGSASQNGSMAPNDPRAGGMLVSSRGNTTVDWQGGMAFDGRTVKFDRDVVALRVDGETTQTVRAPELDVTLHQRVDFGAMGPERQQQTRPQIESLTCHGDVWLENRQLQQGKLVNLDRMEHLSTLTVDQITGELSGQATAEQPGRVQSWRLGAPPALATGVGAAQPMGNSAGVAPGATANSATADRAQINFLDVQFAHGITGNILPVHQNLTFHDNVRCIYGPVPGWDAQLDADSPTGPPPGSMVMTCNQLTTSQAGPRNDSRASTELDAVGNIRVDGQREEGDSFSALAERLTYSQAKDMLVLVGDGRNNAQLFRQEQPNAPQTKTAAGSIYYWPTTRQVKIGDLQFVDSTQFGNQPSPRANSNALPLGGPKSSAVQTPATSPRR